MKIILLEDVKGKGKKNDVINVSDGYGNNYLIKNKLGVLYTKGSSNVLNKELKELKEEEDKLVAELNEKKNKLENKDIKFQVKTGNNEKVFGNISSKQISEKIKELGFNIDKKCLKIDGNLDTLGVHKVLVQLHKKVNFYININLVK